MNLNKVNELISKVNEIDSFESVVQWDNNAKEMLTNLSNYENTLKDEKNSLEKKMIALIEEQGKSFFSKLMNNKKDEIQKINFELSSINSKFNLIKGLERDLNFWIQITPDDKNEKTTMINELKEVKKDLAIQKKELRLAIKETNKNARVSNSKAINQRGFTSYKLVAFQQAVSRSKKELELAPLEDQLKQIEHNELQYDKVIRFLEKIK